MIPVAIVREMIELGADFDIYEVDGVTKWCWTPRPEIMRAAVRRFWRSLAERPSDEAMVAAIRRAYGGAA